MTDSGSDDRKVFVGGIHIQATNDDLFKYFSKFGSVSKVNLKVDVRGASRGFAFITFDEKETLNKVMDTQSHSILNKQVEIKLARPKPGRIFIRGISNSLSDEVVREHFSSFGKILDISLPFDHGTKQRRSYGFITYEDEQSIQKPLSAGFTTINGVTVDIVKFSQRDSQVPMKPDPYAQPTVGSSGPYGNQGYGADPYGGYDVGHYDTAYSAHMDTYSGTVGNPYGANGYGEGYSYDESYATDDFFCDGMPGTAVMEPKPTMQPSRGAYRGRARARSMGSMSSTPQMSAAQRGSRGDSVSGRVARGSMTPARSSIRPPFRGASRGSAMSATPRQRGGGRSRGGSARARAPSMTRSARAQRTPVGGGRFRPY